VSRVKVVSECTCDVGYLCANFSLPTYKASIFSIST